jgi:benzoate-CoA ligase family protein
MTFEPPERRNIADFFLDARLREGRGDRPAVRTDLRTWTYADIHALANRYGNLLAASGADPEDRILIALPDGADYVGALFGTLKIGAVVVMVNPGLAPEEAASLLEYTRARLVVTHADTEAMWRGIASGAAASRATRAVVAVGTPEFDARLAAAPPRLETFPSCEDDPAIWLFSGGTTGRPKAVIQTHRSFRFTTERYGLGVLGYTERDVTISVPKLYFGYATGSNLFFTFAAGGTSVLFPEPVTAEILFDKIAKHRPTVLVNVPTMVQKLVAHPRAATEKLDSLRLSTSAGEALPVELYERWRAAFGVDLLDGLGTAEMWHIFISNRPGAARPGTLGTVVPGFEIMACDEEGRPVPPGETGWLWVRGGARAIAYWQHQEKTEQAFRGEWYVSGDLVAIDAEGYVTYHGRGDEMLKVGGKWLAPQEVEGCLLLHPAVAEAAVVGVIDSSGLMKPVAHIVARERREGLADELKGFVCDRLAPYKHPREITFVDSLPRTHLGKVDRGKLRRG